MMWKAGVYLALLFLLSDWGTASPVGEDSTCETQGTVFEGESATVTCHFHRPHQKFMVYRLRSPGENEIVTVCIHTENGPDCNLLEGHTVTTNADRDQAVLHIASAQQESSGKYFCKTLPASEDNAGNCTLAVQSTTVRTGNFVTCNTNSPVSPGQECWLRCEFPQNVGRTGITLVKQSVYTSSYEEEILVCNRAGNCTLKKEGYKIAEKTTTHVVVSIAQLKNYFTGNYKCKSSTLKGISAGCNLELQVASGTTDVHTGELDHTLPVLATLGAVLAVLVICSVVLFIYRRHGFCKGEYTQTPSSEDTTKRYDQVDLNPVKNRDLSTATTAHHLLIPILEKQVSLGVDSANTRL